MLVKRTVLGAVCLSVAASLWGGMYVVSKYVLDFIPPFTLVWLRYLIAFVVLYAVLKWTERKSGQNEPLTKKQWLLLAWIGFIGYFVSISLQFIGTKLSNAHTGSLITSATPAFIVVFAYFILKESLTVRKVISTCIATIGVVIVIGFDTSVSEYTLGAIILVGAAVTWALLSIYVKVASQELSSLAITTYAILFGFLFTTPAIVFELRQQPLFYESPLIIAGVFYLGIISTAVAFFLWNKGLELMDAGVGSLFFFFQPLVGTFLGWLLLDETLTARFFIGALFIVCGVVIATFATEETAEKRRLSA